jgi:hypothetical protein
MLPASSANAALAAAGEREIVALHDVFDAWLSGRASPEPSAFAPIELALADGFSMVPPNGKRLGRADVIGWLAGAHGSRGADFRIWIEHAALIARHGGTAIFSYDECQHMNGTDTRRRATVVFALSPEPAGPLRWLAVHETWVT